MHWSQTERESWSLESLLHQPGHPFTASSCARRDYLLFTTCYFPLTTRYLLLTTASSCARRDYLLLAIYYLLLAIDYLLLTTYYCLVLHKARLLTTCYVLFTTCYLLLTTASPYTRRDTGSRPRQLPPPRQRLSTTAGSRRALTTHCAHHAHYYPCPLLTLLTMITCQMITTACPLYTHYTHHVYCVDRADGASHTLKAGARRDARL